MNSLLSYFHKSWFHKSFNRFNQPFNLKFTKSFYRRWIYGFISLFVAFSVIISAPLPSHSSSLLELILRGVQVIQLSNLSDRQEVALGRQINEQLLSQQFKKYTNSSINDYVNSIGQRLVENSDRPDIPYVFQVVDSDQVNAFATMGGYVYVTTGLVRLADNEAQLASVMAHEIGHIAARHAVKQMRERAVTAGVLTAAGLDNSTAVNLGVELAVNRPNSREDEYEADQQGVVTLSRTGYAAGAMVDFMKKLLNQSRSTPTFLSTHPATSNRIERLDEVLDPVTAYSGSGLDNAAYRSKTSALR